MIYGGAKPGEGEKRIPGVYLAFGRVGRRKGRASRKGLLDSNATARALSWSGFRSTRGRTSKTLGRREVVLFLERRVGRRASNACVFLFPSGTGMESLRMLVFHTNGAGLTGIRNLTRLLYHTSTYPHDSGLSV